MDDTAQLSFELPFCSIPGCSDESGRPGSHRGMCHVHYRLWLRYGNPLHEETVPTWKPVDLAYAAGIFDGEGYIGIEGGNGRNHHAVLKVQMVEGPVLHWLANTFGGTVKFVRSTKPGQYRDQARWVRGSLKAVVLLEAVKPYLKLKRKQADLCIRLHREGLWKRRPVLYREIQRREELRINMQILNRRGVG